MGLDEGRLLLAVELGSQRQIEIHEVRRGCVVGPRPRRFVVGEEALVRRCWGRRRASSLIVAEHAAAAFLGLVLGMRAVRWGQPLSASALALGRAMRYVKGSLRPGRGERGAPPRASAAEELAQAGLGAAGGARRPRGRLGGAPTTPPSGPARARGPGYWVRVPSSGTKRRAVNWQEAHRSARRTERTHRADSSAAPDASQRCPGRPRLAGARARAAPPKGLSALQPTAAATDH